MSYKKKMPEFKIISYITREENFKARVIEECLKDMNSTLIKDIYQELPDNIEYIKICPFINCDNRPILYIYSIKLHDKEENIISRCFYKSTGTSRSASILNIWFPCDDKPFRKNTGELFLTISKLEDEILDKMIRNKLIYKKYENIEKYCRFINES